MAGILKSCNVDSPVFSGGGNDVVGKWDMERLLKTYRPGLSAEQCIRQDRLIRNDY